MSEALSNTSSHLEKYSRFLTLTRERERLRGIWLVPCAPFRIFNIIIKLEVSMIDKTNLSFQFDADNDFKFVSYE